MLVVHTKVFLLRFGPLKAEAVDGKLDSARLARGPTPTAEDIFDVRSSNTKRSGPLDAWGFGK